MTSSRPWPADLDELSFWIGSNYELVQGPGGNTSFKNGQLIWVKASGTRLEQALQSEIFAEVSLSSGESTSRNELKPSIEKFFHIANPYPYVAHVHSIGSMSVSFRADAESVLTSIQNKISIALIPYSRPGTSLEREISRTLDFMTHQAALLGNHGLLVWGNTSNECKEKIRLIEELFADWKTLGFDSEEVFGNATARDIGSRSLTPDHAVFFSDRLKIEQVVPPQKRWLSEFASALSEAIRRIPTHVEMLFLDAGEVDGLRSWESEIARKAAN